MRPGHQSATCPLLALPAELRNHIYRGVLVAKGPVKITAQSYKQPPLLQARDMIRAETLSLYYGGNLFHLTMHGFVSTAAATWWQHSSIARHLRRHHSNVKYSTEAGRQLRTDQILWLRRIYQRKLPGHALSAHDEEAFKQIAHLSKTAVTLKEVTWENVEEVLQNQIDAAVSSGALVFDG